MISTSGALVSLLFGLAAVVTVSKQFVVSDQTKALLILSLPFFLYGAISGIGANMPSGKYSEPTPEGFEERLTTVWDDSPDQGIADVTQTRLNILKTSRAQTTIKAKRLLRGMRAEVAGVFVVALAVVSIFVGPLSLPTIHVGNTVVDCHGVHGLATASRSACP